MSRAMLSKAYMAEMTEEEVKKYLRRVEIAHETYIKQKEIYAKYNPRINALKAAKAIALEALHEWRNDTYEEENL